MMDGQLDHTTAQDTEHEDETLSRLIKHSEVGKDDEPAAKDGEKGADEESWPSGFGSFP
jgi:hypothetical protein